jgi:hypothetical protein
MMSLINLSNAGADNVGSFLYGHVFHNSMTPLVLVSAAFTAVAFVLVPLLRLGAKPQGKPAASVTAPTTLGSAEQSPAAAR